MKKIVLACLLLLTIFNSAKAQTYTPYPPAGFIQGEVYHNTFSAISSGAPPQINNTIKFIKDTVIGAYNYSYFFCGIDDYYTRYDNGKIYYVTRFQDGSLGAESIQYDFTLQLGNTFNLPWTNNAVVDSVSTITLLNGQVRKYLRLTANSLGGTKKFEWIDGIGDIKNGFFYLTGGTDGGRTEYICTRDNTGMLYERNNTFSCDSLIALTVDVAKINPLDKNIQVYPLPAKHTVNIIMPAQLNISDENTYIMLCDVTGRMLLMQAIQANSTALDISSFAKGFYTINIGNTERHLFTQKLLIE